MPKHCHFVFQNKNEIQRFTINKPNITKKKQQNINNILIVLFVCILIHFGFVKSRTW